MQGVRTYINRKRNMRKLLTKDMLNIECNGDRFYSGIQDASADDGDDDEDTHLRRVHMMMSWHGHLRDH